MAVRYKALGFVNTRDMFKMAMEGGYAVPAYNFNNLEQLQAIINGCGHSKSPIILQVSSSVLPEYVDIINNNSGALEAAVGIPEDQLRKAAKSAVCKINIDSDGRLVVTAIIRKIFKEDPAEFDPRKYLGPAREALIKMIIEKNKNVLGSAGRY